MKGKRRERDFIIISFSASQYIFVFCKDTKVLLNSNNNVESKKSNEFLELCGKSFLFP